MFLNVGITAYILVRNQLFPRNQSHYYALQLMIKFGIIWHHPQFGVSAHVRDLDLKDFKDFF